MTEFKYELRQLVFRNGEVFKTRHVRFDWFTYQTRPNTEQRGIEDDKDVVWLYTAETREKD